MLAEKMGHEISLITLSEKGVFYHERARAAIISSHVRNIADVSGAGDTVIAVASLVYAKTRDAGLMAEVANIAGRGWWRNARLLGEVGIKLKYGG
jgi:bifunctional ADP-heptose synthase (sugar kinase/adenylyltransferase)